MPRPVVPLSDAKSGEPRPAPRPSACPTATACTCSSSRAASALWRFDYLLQGRRNTLSLGTYPEVSLALARARRAEARAKVAAGIDPSRERQAAREAAAQAMTFGEVADEWLERQRHVLAPDTFEKATWMLKTLVGPWLGKRPIAEIEPPELLHGAPPHRGPRQTRDRASGRSSVAARFSAMRSRPGARSATPPPTCAAR